MKIGLKKTYCFASPVGWNQSLGRTLAGLIAAFCLLVAMALPVAASVTAQLLPPIEPLATPAAGPKAAPVIQKGGSYDSNGWIRIDAPIAICAPGLAEWYQTGIAKPLKVYVDGIDVCVTSNDIRTDKLTNDWLTIYLARDPSNQNSRNAWNRILCCPTNIFGAPKMLHVTLGREGELPLVSGLDLPIRAINQGWFILWLSLVGLLLICLIQLGRKSDLLRDGGPGPASGKKSFSLARTQMAFWFFITVASYLFIFFVTHDTDTLTPQVLVLIGISATTGFGAMALDNSKRVSLETQLEEAEMKAAEQQLPAGKTISTVQRTGLNQALNKVEELKVALEISPSRGFWRDLLRDGQGVSFHRLQIVVWTLVVGLIFVRSAYSALAMPQLSDALLGLMGISGGTYLGFKIPEKLG